MAAELKQVLDSWVRYEQQAKEAEQAELAKSVIERVLKTLHDQKSQKDILLGAVAELERTCTCGLSLYILFIIFVYSASEEQSHLAESEITFRRTGLKRVPIERAYNP